jgi:CheY-like chemotaxis protein
MDRVLRAHPRSPDRALIIEDDRRVASLHRAFLEVEGLEVVEVAGSLEAALRALELAPDLVLLDLYLPDGNGLDLLPALAGAYVLVITAAKDAPTVERALLGGAMDYIVKPFGRARLREALTRYRAFRSLRHKAAVSHAGGPGPPPGPPGEPQRPGPLYRGADPGLSGRSWSPDSGRGGGGPRPFPGYRLALPGGAEAGGAGAGGAPLRGPGKALEGVPRRSSLKGMEPDPSPQHPPGHQWKGVWLRIRPSWVCR